MTGTLLLLSDTPVRRDPEGRIWSTSVPLEFFCKLARGWDRTRLCAPVGPDRPPEAFPFLVAAPDLDIKISERAWMRKKIDWLRSPLGILRDIRTIWRDFGACDHALVRGPTPILPIVLAIAWLRGKRKVTTYYAAGDIVSRNPSGLRGLLARGLGAVEKLAAKRFAVIVAGEALQRRLGGQIAFANRISLAEIDNAPRPPAVAPFQLLFLGAIARSKGLEVLARALASMAAQDRALVANVRLHGQETQDTESLRELVADLGLSDLMRFEGRLVGRDAIIAAIRAADLLVLPSLTEGIPKVVLEAGAFGLPVLASDTGGIPVLVAPFEAAELVEAGNADALATALVALLDSPDRRLALSANGLALARANSEEALLERFTLAIKAGATARRATA